MTFTLTNVVAAIALTGALTLSGLWLLAEFRRARRWGLTVVTAILLVVLGLCFFANSVVLVAAITLGVPWR